MFTHIPGKTALTAGLLALALATSAAAQTATKLPATDAKFLQKAAEDGMAEVELGNLATQKAMREEVKQFAARMVEDHGKANEELKAVASAHGVALPAGPAKKHQKEKARLEKLVGGDFDRAYMKLMVNEHKKDVDEFREHARSRRDNDARAFAAKTLPILQSHLDAAIATRDVAFAPKRSGNRETGSTKK
jgi:putative membrane protein